MTTFPEELRQTQYEEGQIKSWLNRLLTAAKISSVLIGGNGIVVSRTAVGTMISLANERREVELPATITQVHTTGQPPFMAQNVAYTAKARYYETTIGPVAPKYGRPCTGEGAVEPCVVGDRCWIVREIDDEGNVTAQLRVGSERFVVSAECG